MRENEHRGLLEGRVAIVTGGGGGIGRGIALAYAAAGANVAVADIEPTRCDETARRVHELGRRALPLPTDVMDTDQIHAMVEKVDETFGRIDILCNNAGGVSGRPFLDQSERSWRRHIDINLVSMLCATSLVGKIMVREGRGGTMLNVSSIEGSRAAPSFAVYAACKAGMQSFTRSMAVELAEHRIRVNCIAPDHTKTPGNHGNRHGPVDPSSWPPDTEESLAAWRRLIPLGYEGEPEECGDVAVFLASDLSRYVTGATIPVDGGTWASSGWVRSREDESSWTLVEGMSQGSQLLGDS